MATAPCFGGEDSAITYKSWKEQIDDRFEFDDWLYPIERHKMAYVFGRTEGDAWEYLQPRYTRDAGNTEPYTSVKEMFATLDLVYINLHKKADARAKYNGL